MPGPTGRFDAMEPDGKGAVPAQRYPQPAEGSTVSTALTTLDWDDVPGATRYEVYFGKRAKLGYGALRGTVLLSQWPLDVELVPRTTYYWMITAVNPYGKATGSVWRFTTAALPPPASPSAPSPADGQTSASLNLVALDWADVEGAKSYSVFFGTKRRLDLNDHRGDVSLSRWQLGSALSPGTTYFWKVVARNPTGSSTGALWRFTTDKASPPGRF